MSDTETHHRCRRCHAISTGPCCSKCKAPHVHNCDKDYVPWRMSFDNRGTVGETEVCAKINPLTGLPWAIVPGGGLGFDANGFPLNPVPTDVDPPSDPIPSPPTDPDADDEDSGVPQGGIDRSLVTLPTSCGGDPVSFDFTVYPGNGIPYVTVAFDPNGQAFPGTFEITDSVGTVIGPCDVLTPPPAGQVLTATFTPDANCELVGFTGTPAPSGNYNGQVVTNQYKASPADCPNTNPDATGTKEVAVSYNTNDDFPCMLFGFYACSGGCISGAPVPLYRIHPEFASDPTFSPWWASCTPFSTFSWQGTPPSTCDVMYVANCFIGDYSAALVRYASTGEWFFFVWDDDPTIQSFQFGPIQFGTALGFGYESEALYSCTPTYSGASTPMICFFSNLPGPGGSCPYDFDSATWTWPGRTRPPIVSL